MKIYKNNNNQSFQFEAKGCILNFKRAYLPFFLIFQLFLLKTFQPISHIQTLIFCNFVSCQLIRKKTCSLFTNIFGHVFSSAAARGSSNRKYAPLEPIQSQTGDIFADNFVIFAEKHKCKQFRHIFGEIVCKYGLCLDLRVQHSGVSAGLLQTVIFFYKL